MLNTHTNFLIKTLEEHGHTAYIVGGCVRDILMGKTPKDWDIATSAKPDEIKAIFNKTIDTGIKHGTVSVMIKNTRYEVTTYRQDGEYTDLRRPDDVKFVSDIVLDLSRRDFTINAIAYNPRTGIVDPFLGQDDIKHKIIRCVGYPVMRFNEDALRMLRALRFAAVLDFDIQEDVICAIKVLSHNIKYISPERIKDELCKLICGTNIILLKTTGLLEHIIEYKGDLQENADFIKKCPVDINMRLSLFLKDENAYEILKGLRFDNKSIKEICMYVSYFNINIKLCRVDIKKHLRNIPLEWFFNILLLKQIVFSIETDEYISIANDIIQKKECFTIKGLAVNGNDLKEYGLTGKDIGQGLEFLLDMVIHSPEMNTKELLLKCLD